MSNDGDGLKAATYHSSYGELRLIMKNTFCPCQSSEHSPPVNLAGIEANRKEKIY
jgi:hypothetical protein